MQLRFPSPRIPSRVWLLCLLLPAVVGCDKVQVDYDKDAPFSSYKTYMWADGNDVDEINELVHRRIVAAIDEQMRLEGFQQVQSDPDVYVTYHATFEDQMVVDTTHYGYGYGPGWGWYGGMGGMGSSTSRTRQYTQGTFVIDIWDAKKKQLVWRAAKTGTVDEKTGTDDKKVRKGAAEFFKQYPPDVTR